MRHLIALASFLSTITFAQSAQFRGASAVEEVLSERLWSPGSTISLARYIDYNLRSLLGARVAFGGESVFSNGEPNSVNMLLWNVSLQGVADEIALNCSFNSFPPLNNKFKAALQKVCLWPEESAKSNSVLQEYWLAVMGYDAPIEEFEAWRDFFLTSSFAKKSAQETISPLTFAILYNPHFLLRK